MNDKENGLEDFSDKISARVPCMKKFLAQASLSVEVALHKKLVELSGMSEVDLFRQRVDRDAKLPTLEQIWRSTVSSTSNNIENQKRRTLPVCLVLGPSGSGKTCFSLHYWTKGFLKSNEKHQCTV